MSINQGDPLEVRRPSLARMATDRRYANHHRQRKLIDARSWLAGPPTGSLEALSLLEECRRRGIGRAYSHRDAT